MNFNIKIGFSEMLENPRDVYYQKSVCFDNEEEIERFFHENNVLLDEMLMAPVSRVELNKQDFGELEGKVVSVRLYHTDEDGDEYEGDLYCRHKVYAKC